MNASLRSWERNGAPRRAGVSSFGIGGTNAHVIVEEAPEPEPGGASKREWQVLPLSAKTEGALDAITNNLTARLDQSTDELADVGYTLSVGRRAFSHRRVVLCRDREQALAALRGEVEAHVLMSGRERQPGVVLLYPGQGAQRVNMGHGPYESEDVYRQVVDHCATVLQDCSASIFVRSLSAMLVESQLQQTQWAQLGAFVTEYALTEQLRAWVLSLKRSSATASASGWGTVAGVFKLDDALRLGGTARTVDAAHARWRDAECGAAGDGDGAAHRARQEELGRVEVSAVNGARSDRYWWSDRDDRTLDEDAAGRRLDQAFIDEPRVPHVANGRSE